MNPSRLQGEKAPLGLAFDTTFDDTSLALIRGKREILASLSQSQYQAHAEFGGVVPERASRRHLEAIHPLMVQLFAQAQGPAPEDLSWVAASHTPGLTGAIMVGMTVAKSLAFCLKAAFFGINHIEAHPYANFLVHPDFAFPCIHLVAAGGHTVLLRQEAHFQWQILGGSMDDAAGECLDKAAKRYGLPMPGGARIDHYAQTHAPFPHRFPRPLLKSPDLNFSFSGLKTALANFQAANPGAPKEPVLVGVLESVVDVLLEKSLRACRQEKIPRLSLSGGLSASRYLQRRFQETCAQEQIRLFAPPPRLCTDNAEMVACLAAWHHEANPLGHPFSLPAQANLAC